MSFISKATEVLTGKTESERKLEKASAVELRKEVMSERLKARKEEAIKFARESERIKYQNKLKELRRPTPRFAGFNAVSPEYATYGSLTGAPRFIKERTIVKRGKKGKNKKVRLRTVPKYKFSQMASPPSYNVLGL